MSWLMLLLLLGMVAEAGRESLSDGVKGWAARHYPRLMIARELPWWAERKSSREKKEHARHHHIDLLARPRLSGRKKR